MPSFKKVNKAIAEAFPFLDIEAVNGGTYIYFEGYDGFDKVESVMCYVRSISTADLERLCIEAIQCAYNL